jgi:uncharacterized membrane protein
MALTPESPAIPHRDAVPGIDQDVHAAADAQAYLRGSQEINEQAATYSLFMNIAKWGSLATAVVLLWLVLWFQPGGTLIGGLIPAVVLAVAGWWFLRSKPSH